MGCGVSKATRTKSVSTSSESDDNENKQQNAQSLANDNDNNQPSTPKPDISKLTSQTSANGDKEKSKTGQTTDGPIVGGDETGASELISKTDLLSSGVNEKKKDLTGHAGDSITEHDLKDVSQDEHSDDSITEHDLKDVSQDEHSDDSITEHDLKDVSQDEHSDDSITEHDLKDVSQDEHSDDSITEHDLKDVSQDEHSDDSITEHDLKDVSQDEHGDDSITEHDLNAVSQNVRGDESKTEHDLKDLFRILRGDFSVQCPPVAKLVRIFVSSTFTDTEHERNWLMERVYPKLKEFCQSKGYEFQIVDMRWGIRDEAQDDHMTTEICLREVEESKETSTGPCFMSLMSHKYGWRDFPRTILASEFDLLIECVEDDIVKGYLQSWFQKDENSLPAIYVLQPISSKLTNEAWDNWLIQNSQMHTALAIAAEKTAEKGLMDVERVSVYKRSVSDTETITCLKDCSPEKLVWFHRIIEDIDKVDPDKEKAILERYKDQSGSPIKDKESQRLLTDLKNKTLKKNLPPENISEYRVKWEPGKGIDPDLNQEHKQYLSKLCKDSKKLLRSLLKSAFNSRDKLGVENPVYTEALQHMNFCQNKCEAFYGREDSLKIIENYLKGDSRQPLVIYGKSGCGKTSLIAMAVKLANQIHGDKSVNIIRFIGTTPDSSSLHTFLTSVINQLRQAVSMDVLELDAKTIEELTSELMETIKAVAGLNKQIVLFFDSLDQFDPAHGSRRMKWLGDLENLPEKCKVILSTLPDAQYEALPILQAKLQKFPDNFLAVPELKKNDVEGILTKWLESASRTLTDQQREIVLNVFNNCPLPLYLRLSFDEAVKWKTYSPESITVLEDTVRGCIDKLFLQMETNHGKIFVAKALGYLTSSHSGLSEAELEDILSCDEDVLGDVYRYWTPPIRRLPPLLLVRMKRDLGHYVVTRGARGRQVFYWYHRQFIEAAQNRYCSDSEVTRKLHEGMADFFAGTWEEGHPKPYIGTDGTVHQADRHVSSQPLKQGTEFNVRKLTSLPYHRVRAGDVDKLKKNCLLNYKFLVAKIEACGLSSVLEDFSDAREGFPDDQELALLREALVLSQNALRYDVRTFSSQLLDRIQGSELQSYPAMSKLIEDCRNPDHIYLITDRPILAPIGQQLVSSIEEHTKQITAFAMDKTATMAVTCSDDETINVYDLTKGRVVQTIHNVDVEVRNATLACGDTVVVIGTREKISTWDLKTGVCQWTAAQDRYVLGGLDNSKILIISLETSSYKFLNTKDGEIIKDNTSIPEEIVNKRWRFHMVGHDKWMVYVSRPSFGRSISCSVFDVDSMTLSHYKKLPFQAEGTGLAISPDGDTLYILNFKGLNYVKTSTLEILKSLQGCTRIDWEKVHMDPSGKYVYCAGIRRVHVWDVQAGQETSLLDLPNNVCQMLDVQTLDMNSIVTIHFDWTLRIWDLSRGNESKREDPDLPQHQSETGTSNRFYIRSIYPTESPRYFVMEWTVINQKEKVVAVYDTALRQYVRQASYANKKHGTFSILKYINEWTVILTHNNRLKLLDLQTMKVTTALQRKPTTNDPWPIVVNGGKDIAVLSSRCRKVKILSRQTGKTEAIMNAGHSERLESMITNKPGTVIATQVRNQPGQILIFDSIHRVFDFEITLEMLGLAEHMNTPNNVVETSLLTDDGQYLFFSLRYLEENWRVTSLFVINLKTRKLEHILLNQKVKTLVEVEGMVLLDDTQLLTCHSDGVIRIFNFKTGTELKRLSQHLSGPILSYHMGSAIIVTQGYSDLDYVIHLWDAETLKRFAVYTNDTGLSNFQVLGPNSSTFLATLDKQLAPVFFFLKGKGAEKYTEGTVSEATFPEVFNGVNAVSEIDLSHPDEMTIDDDDPDDDPESDDDSYVIVNEESTLLFNWLKSARVVQS